MAAADVVEVGKVDVVNINNGAGFESHVRLIPPHTRRDTAGAQLRIGPA